MAIITKYGCRKYKNKNFVRQTNYLLMLLRQYHVEIVQAKCGLVVVHFKMSKDRFYGKWRYRNIGSRIQGTRGSIYIFPKEEKQWIIENY